MTAVDIDGESFELSEPVIRLHKNQLIKQWSPFLKEIWIERSKKTRHHMMSFEITRPEFLDDESEKLTLTYKVKTNEINSGPSTGDSISLGFHSGEFDPMKPIMGLGGSYCDDAEDIYQPGSGSQYF